MTLQLQLSDEEARLLAAHLSWHLRQLDAELVRTDRRELQHALAAEAEKIRGLANRISVPEPVPAPVSPWTDVMTDGEGDPIEREDLAGT